MADKTYAWLIEAARRAGMEAGTAEVRVFGDRPHIVIGPFHTEPEAQRLLDAIATGTKTAPELEQLRKELDALRVDHAEKTQLWLQAAKRAGELVGQVGQGGKIILSLRNVLGLLPDTELLAGALNVRTERDKLRGLVAELEAVVSELRGTMKDAAADLQEIRDTL